MQYTENVLVVKIENFTRKKKDIFLIFAQNIDCGYTLESTHNLCFGAKIRKIGIPPCIPQFRYIKMGFKGVYMSQICFPDGNDV